VRRTIVVELTDEEVDDHHSLATKQCNAKEDGIRENDSGYHRNHTMSDKNDRALPHRIGMIGALAYAKYMGVGVNREVYTNHGDTIDFDGTEVKTSTWMKSNVELKVKVKEYKKKIPRKYVLARVNPANWRRVELMGEISRSEFDIKKRRRNYGNEDNWIVGVCDLHTVKKAARKHV